MFRFIVLMISLGAAVDTLAAECLSVSENNLEEIGTDYGMTTVEWSAEIRNSCDASYDGTLTVRLLDKNGDMLHEALEIIILQKNTSETTSKRITLPADTYKALDEIDIDIRERERPT